MYVDTIEEYREKLKNRIIFQFKFMIYLIIILLIIDIIIIFGLNLDKNELYYVLLPINGVVLGYTGILLLLIVINNLYLLLNTYNYIGTFFGNIIGIIVILIITLFLLMLLLEKKILIDFIKKINYFK